jgi:hypothetical protein
MKGLSHTLFMRLQERYRHEPFKLASAILEARVVPKRITPELDDVEVERRLEAVLRESTSA